MWHSMMMVEQELYDIELEKARSMKDAISLYSEDWVSCNNEDLKNGDIVYVEYFPDSQKYLYTHCPEYGTVQEIYINEYESPSLNKMVKELAIKILNHNGQIINLNKDNLSMYSRGYFMDIKKYQLNHPRTPVIDNTIYYNSD